MRSEYNCDAIKRKFFPFHCFPLSRFFDDDAMKSAIWWNYCQDNGLYKKAIVCHQVDFSIPLAVFSFYGHILQWDYILMGFCSHQQKKEWVKAEDVKRKWIRMTWLFRLESWGLIFLGKDKIFFLIFRYDNNYIILSLIKYKEFLFENPKIFYKKNYISHSISVIDFLERYPL